MSNGRDVLLIEGLESALALERRGHGLRRMVGRQDGREIATTASPTNLSTNPPASSIASPIEVRYAFMRATISCGGVPSESAENPTTSEKNNVISRFRRPAWVARQLIRRSMTLGER